VEDHHRRVAEGLDLAAVGAELSDDLLVPVVHVVVGHLTHAAEFIGIASIFDRHGASTEAGGHVDDRLRP
jgi:hypothetical protein